MDCINVSQDLHHYLDGEMGRLRRLAFARHLESCAACSAGAQFEVRFRQTLWSKCQDDPPADLHRRILDALGQAALPGHRIEGAFGDPAPELGGPADD